MNSPSPKFILLAILLALAGCNLGRYVLKVAGDAPVDAQYIPAQKPLVVIVKDVPDPTGLRVESEEIAADIEDQFTKFKVAPIVSSLKVAELRTRQPSEFNRMSPAKIGKAVGAEQVLYVEITSSKLDNEANPDLMRGRISASVRMIDANTSETLWPADGSGSTTITAETPLRRLGDTYNQMNIEQSLHEMLADKIGKVFRKYKPDN